jgi:tRNA (Thr-GGU) A37 N-methylase
MFSVKPIAYIRNNREAIEDDHWGNIVSTIELTSEFSEESMHGIEDFSHLEVIFYFNQVQDDNIQFDARHPRIIKSTLR